MRLPIGIWDKSLWGKGYGKELVVSLMRYAFEALKIDRFCAMDVKAENIRSRALWTSLDLKPVRGLDKGDVLDFEINKSEYF
jgi:RimJ/RimL family protein N-acetyltransferase